MCWLRLNKEVFDARPQRGQPAQSLPLIELAGSRHPTAIAQTVSRSDAIQPSRLRHSRGKRTADFPTVALHSIAHFRCREAAVTAPFSDRSPAQSGVLWRALGGMAGSTTDDGRIKRREVCGIPHLAFLNIREQIQQVDAMCGFLVLRPLDPFGA
jgi:hypothetical protein